MNLFSFTRFLKPLLMISCLAIIIGGMAISIQLFYQVYLFIESALETSSRQAGQYVVAIAACQ